jgi:hypothetical protein
MSFLKVSRGVLKKKLTSIDIDSISKAMSIRRNTGGLTGA